MSNKTLILLTPRSDGDGIELADSYDTAQISSTAGLYNSTVKLFILTVRRTLLTSLIKLMISLLNYDQFQTQIINEITYTSELMTSESQEGKTHLST